MSTPATADDLVTLVRKSGLLDEAKLTTFLQSHQKDGALRADARTLAVTMIRESLLTNFQAEQFLLGKWKGFTLGKFKLLERIGFGGMGQVFLCEHRFMRKRMAVKVLPPTKAEDPVALGRFYREARLASGLEHPNIVRTYDIDQDGPLHFLVMEYVDGSTLLDIVSKFGPLNAVRAAAYVRMAAAGLQFAHTQGMIHRDVKPGNIILGRGGVAKILDMGLARLSQDEKDQITVKYDDKNVLGSADYVAPEQTRDSRNIDIRADIYGMGATFYFILAGQPPFPDGSVAAKIIAHQTRKPKPVREVRPDVPQGLAKIVEKMMAKDPNDRYQTPQEIVDVLEVWTQAAPEPPPAEWMPQLSAAATELPYVGGSAASPSAAGHARSDAAKPRSAAGPALRAPELAEAAFESGATVPVPPPRPAMTATNSVVDLVLPPMTKSGAPVARLVPPEARTPSPGRPALTDTPRPPVRDLPRLPSSPPPELPKLPPELTRLSPSRVPAAPRPDAGRPAGPPPKEPTETDVTKPLPPVTPAEPVRTFPSLRDALRGSAVPEYSKPIPLEQPRVPPPEPPKRVPPIAPLGGSRDALRPRLSGSKHASPWVGPGATIAPAETPRVPPSGAPAKPPIYRAPKLMPFFDQPGMPPQQSALARLLRWLLMMMISTVIGAMLGVAIWYQFMRR